MELPVTLTGHQASWVYRGSRELHAWVVSQPWLKGGGVTRVRLGANGDVDLLIDGLRRAVRSADEAGYQPLVASLTVADKLVPALHADLCGSAVVDERQIIDECSFKHRLFITLTESGGASLADQARAFSDRARKVAPDFASAFVIVSTGANSADGDELDFTSGSPNDYVLRLLDETQERLFRGYLHARLAWESAGSINRARGIESVIGSIRVGDDEALEVGLNEFARGVYGELAVSDKRCLGEFLAAIMRGASVDARRIASELGDAGLLWSPYGSERWRVVPWVARASLLTDGSVESTMLLRSQLICAPLARELLGRCLDLEARERAKLTRQIGSYLPPAEAVARLASFQRRDTQGDAPLYPRCSPARPRDAWAFAEFGGFIEAAERAGAARRHVSELHSLRLLRNALAHGHFAGWAALRRLLEIENRLGSAV